MNGLKITATLVAIVALTCMTGAAADDTKGEGQGKKGGALRGQVKAVDATKSTITLSVREGNDDVENAPLVDRTFAVAKDATIVVDGKTAKLGDVKPASQATVNLSEDRKTVTRITVGRGKGGDTEGERSQPKREEKGKGG